MQLIETTGRTSLGVIEGLGDLSHASMVYSRDGRFAFVFGRDGGLTKVDLLQCAIAKRVVQAGNSIGGAISQDGSLVAVANYDPGARVFDAATLEPVADIPATYGPANARSKVVGLVDAPGRRFVFSLYDAGEIWVADLSDPAEPEIRKFADVGVQPYDGMITPMAATTSRGCSARTAWRCSICGIWTRACSASWMATVAARSRCRSTRCRIWRAGRAPARSWSCRRSAATSCWWWTAAPGRRSIASPCTASRCSRWRGPTAARSGSTSPTPTTPSSR